MTTVGGEPGFNPLESIPPTNVTGFCTINERGIGSLNLKDLCNTGARACVYEREVYELPPTRADTDLAGLSTLFSPTPQWQST